MADFIKINKKGSLKELLNYIAKAKGSTVYVSIASDSLLWQLKSLRLIRRAGVEVGKKVVIVTSGRVSQIKANQAGLPTLPEDEIAKKVSPAKSEEVVSHDEESPAAWLTRKFDTPKKLSVLDRKKRRWIYAASALVALTAGFFASNIFLQKAVITVYARTEEKSASTDIILDGSQQVDDQATKTLSAIPVDRTVNANHSFKAEGKTNDGTKATGSVIIKSSYPTTLTLRASTTYFIDANGKRYLPNADIVGLRPNIDYPMLVTAAESGQDYNLEVGTRLELHNAAFGNRPQVLYAITDEGGLTGGSDIISTMVSEEDLNKARQELTDQMIKAVEEDLRKNLDPDIRLITELTKLEVISEEFDAKAGELKEQFNASITARVRGLAFRQSAMNNMLAADAQNGLSSTERFVEIKQGSLQYNLRSVDIDKNIGALNVVYSNVMTSRLDPEDLKILLSGRKTDEIKSLLLQKSEIAGVKIDISPFWLRTTPKSAKKVKVKVELDGRQ